MNEHNKSVALFVKGMYDLQELRIKSGQRLFAQFRSKLGLNSSAPEESDEDAKKVIDLVRINYRTVCEGMKKELPALKDFKGEGLISDYTELNLVHVYMELERQERGHVRRLETILEQVPIYKEFLVKVRGCGPITSGCIIAELDPHKARHVSSFWKYAGYDVVCTRNDDGAERWQGRSKQKHHLVKQTYKDKDGKEQEKDGITFNPFLKTKLHVLATCFIKAGGKYRDVYDGYKHRLQQRIDIENPTKGHLHAMALRYMIKIFLQDLWRTWRTLEGLPVTEPYAVAKLNLPVHGSNEGALKIAA